ncbi:hypothetical protein BX265_2343 [Streptomyces sp. TLI_235]|nr:hypothetical protein [Streptomyces sp. TLI_235]PBC77592.1 hypothetical protein BX265_2343 [Streptomyces sp. TLI_235]
MPTIHGPAGQTIELPDGTTHPALDTALQAAAETKTTLDTARRTNTPKKQLADLQATADTAFNTARTLANNEAHHWTAHLDAQLRLAVADIHDHLAAAQHAAEHAANLLAARQVATGERPWEMNTRGLPDSDDRKRAKFLAAGINDLRNLPPITEHRP